MINEHELPDYTGVNPNFKMVGEIIEDASVLNGYFVLSKGAFYTTSLLVLDTVTGAELVPEVDYKAVVLDSAATGHSGGKPVHTLINLLKPTGNNLIIDYQYVGGIYVDQVSTLTRLISNMEGRVASNILYSQVDNRPVVMDVALEHQHDANDVTGKEEEISALVQISEQLARIAGPADISGIENKVDQLDDLAKDNQQALVTNAEEHLVYDLLHNVMSESEYIAIATERMSNRSGSGDDVKSMDFNELFIESPTENSFVIPERNRVVNGDLVYRPTKTILGIPAPDGTKVYNSVTNATVSRPTPSVAFSGLITNGDFSDDLTGWTTDGAGVNYAVNDGILSANRVTADVVHNITQEITNRTVGETYVCRMVAKSTTGDNTVTITNGDGADVVIPIEEGSFKEHVVEYVAVSGTDSIIMTLQEDLLGASAQIASISILPKSDTVITHRKDLSGLEVFHEDISVLDAVCLYGDVQNEVATWNGITFVEDLVPQAYCGFSKYDTTTKGLFVKWSTLPLEDKIKFVSEPLNNMYLSESGKLIQVRSRDRVIDGYGSKWHSINGVGRLAFSPDLLVAPRGTNTSPSIELHTSATALGSAVGFYQATKDSTIPDLGAPLGSSTAVNGDSTYPNSDVGYKGRCSIVMNATIQMLNSGVYHPRNPLGTKLASDGNMFNTTGVKLHSLVDCFNPSNATTASGTKASGISGRPVGDLFQYSDVILSNQINSLRNSTKTLTTKEFMNFSNKAFEDSLRVSGKLPFVKITKLTITNKGTEDGGNFYHFQDSGSHAYNPVTSTSMVNGTYFVHESTGSVLVPSALPDDTGAFLSTDLRLTNTDNKALADWADGEVSDVIWLVESTDTDIELDTVPYQVVIGLPSVVYDMDDLSSGWYGAYCPTLPDDTLRRFYFRDKVIDYSVGYIAPTGETWDFSNSGWDSDLEGPNNSREETIPAAMVQLHTGAVRGKGYSGSISRVVEDGLVNSLSVNFNYSRLGGGLSEQLLDYPLNNTGDKVSGVNYPTYGYSLPGNVLSTDTLDGISHPNVNLGTPTTTDVGLPSGIKLTTYVTSINNQPHLQHIYNGLSYDTDNWGDTGMLSIDDNRTVVADGNGNNVLSGQKVSNAPLPYFIK